MAGKNASLALVMSVPLFIVMLVVTRLFAAAATCQKATSAQTTLRLPCQTFGVTEIDLLRAITIF